ncbi:MAG: NlpC/P60 family protein [Mycobacteriales bacterium]
MATRHASPRMSVLLGLALATSVTVLPAGIGHADPRPSLREVEQRVNALNDKVDVAVEQYAESKIALAAATRRSAVAQARVRAAQAELDAIRRHMSSVAAAAYRSGGTDQFVQLVNTSTPQTFLDRASSLDRIAAGQSAQLAAAQTARHRLAAVRADAAREQASQTAVAQAMAAQKSQIESALAEEQRLLSSLKADERRRLNAARQAAARRAAEAARASRSRSVDVGTYTGPASGRAGVAVQEAYNKLGSPYRWGASGPSEFDCSGLTMWVWAKAGVSLPHSSQAQYSSGPHVSRGDLQPGDLVFFGSPIHHVGIYIGGGRMISAPKTGDVVKIQDAFRSDYAGAVRP